MAGDTHYEVLGISPGTEPAAVRRAYVSHARQFHPDFHAAASPEVQAHAEAKMREINAAWAVLGNTSARTKYDRELRSAGRFQETGPAATTAHSRARQPVEHEAGSGTAPPRWLTMLPPLSLFMAIVCFAIGLVTGLGALLAGAIGFAVLGSVLFAVVPMVALKRSKQGTREPNGSTVSA